MDAHLRDSKYFRKHNRNSLLSYNFLKSPSIITYFVLLIDILENGKDGILTKCNGHKHNPRA